MLKPKCYFYLTHSLKSAVDSTGKKYPTQLARKAGQSPVEQKCIKIIAANTILAIAHEGKSCGQNQQHVQ